MWQGLVKIISEAIPGLIKAYLVPMILSAVGVAGGAYAWIAGFVLNKAWKAADKEIEAEASTEDQAIKDKEGLTQYKKDIQSGAPESKLIDDETSLLSGERKP